MATATKKKPPVEELRVGRIKVVIWENQTDDGVKYSVTAPIRLYKDGAEWKETHSLGRDDLLPAARLLEQAFDKVHELQRAE